MKKGLSLSKRKKLAFHSTYYPVFVQGLKSRAKIYERITGKLGPKNIGSKGPKSRAHRLKNPFNSRRLFLRLPNMLIPLQDNIEVPWKFAPVEYMLPVESMLNDTRNDKE